MPASSTTALAFSIFLAAVVPAADASASAPDAGAADGDDAGASTPAPNDAGAPPPSDASYPPPKLRGEVSACSVGAGDASAADLGVLLIALAGLLRRRTRT